MGIMNCLFCAVCRACDTHIFTLHCDVVFNALLRPARMFALAVNIVSLFLASHNVCNIVADIAGAVVVVDDGVVIIVFADEGL